MTPLAIIPARSGSKGIPGKNLRDFCGKPLMEWAIWAAYDGYVDPVCVTTDDPAIVNAAVRVARVIQRPPELAADDTPMLPVIQHALAVAATWKRPIAPDVVVILQPTAPLRRPEHIRAALKLLETSGADSVVSVVEIPAHYSPDYARKITRSGHLAPLDCDYCGTRLSLEPARRQDCDKAYSRDGTVYVTRREVIEAGSLYGDKCVPLIIPPHESANIDTEEDWQRAERIMRERISVDCPCCLGDGSHEREACSECSGGRMLPQEAEAWKSGARA